MGWIPSWLHQALPLRRRSWDRHWSCEGHFAWRLLGQSRLFRPQDNPIDSESKASDRSSHLAETTFQAPGEPFLQLLGQRIEVWPGEGCDVGNRPGGLRRSIPRLDVLGRLLLILHRFHLTF